MREIKSSAKGRKSSMQTNLNKFSLQFTVSKDDLEVIEALSEYIHGPVGIRRPYIVCYQGVT